jgi:hypothetical protein
LDITDDVPGTDAVHLKVESFMKAFELHVVSVNPFLLLHVHLLSLIFLITMRATLANGSVTDQEDYLEDYLGFLREAVGVMAGLEFAQDNTKLLCPLVTLSYYSLLSDLAFSFMFFPGGAVRAAACCFILPVTAVLTKLGRVQMLRHILKGAGFTFPLAAFPDGVFLLIFGIFS